MQRLKLALKDKAPKTVNNVLTVLSMTLKKAVEWDVIERLPCTIRLLPVPKPAPTFHDFDQHEQLVDAARAIDREAYLIVLLGGEAGLRCGEMTALEWSDIDLTTRQLCVQRSDWNGQVTIPKGGRLRYIPLTVRLMAALGNIATCGARACSVRKMASMTQRHMHLSPAALAVAIRLLDGRGNSEATAAGENRKSND